MENKDENNVPYVPIENKILLTPKEVKALTGIGARTIDDLARKPGCPFVLYVGKKKLIKRKQFEDYIANQIEI